jgi:peptide-methionine (S)-S-oxide reductase
MLMINQFRNYLSGRIAALLVLALLSNLAVAAEQTAVFAGGCFWGVDAVFKHVKGVTGVVSGYSGGSAATAKYELVSNGDTGHAESVQVRYDPTRVTYQQLLQVFFKVAHNPTQLNRQGPDSGTQYRSAIFYSGNEQQNVAQSYIQKITTAHTFPDPIVTQVVPLKQFYAAEEHHQNYLALHPNQAYIVINDQPKVERLQKQFPDLYQ